MLDALFDTGSCLCSCILEDLFTVEHIIHKVRTLLHKTSEDDTKSSY